MQPLHTPATAAWPFRSSSAVQQQQPDQATLASEAEGSVEDEGPGIPAFGIDALRIACTYLAMTTSETESSVKDEAGGHLVCCCVRHCTHRSCRARGAARSDAHEMHRTLHKTIPLCPQDEGSSGNCV
eukprot:1158721-Pelagomonas_calceolata.AAC.8